jgi:hypothetical protein
VTSPSLKTTFKNNSIAGSKSELSFTEFKQDLRFSQRWSWRVLSSGIQCKVLSTCFHSGFLLGLFFDPEDGGDMFHRNVGWLSKDYTALYPRRYSSSALNFLCLLLRLQGVEDAWLFNMEQMTEWESGSATVSTMKPTWPDLGSNLGSRGRKDLIIPLAKALKEIRK